MWMLMVGAGSKDGLLVTWDVQTLGSSGSPSSEDESASVYCHRSRSWLWRHPGVGLRCLSSPAYSDLFSYIFGT